MAELEEKEAVYLRATVAYDGTDFLGFQVQARGRTVQSVLEQALTRLNGAPVRIVGAGRTDSGVHANEQVIAFSLRWRHDLVTLRRALNAILPVDVAVLRLEPAAEKFHPRFSARSREYRYFLWRGEVRSPLHERFSYHVPGALDFALMQRAARLLLGRHDFSAFGKPPAGHNPVREILQSDWWQDGRMWLYRVEANAFLWRMVRRLVMALIWVGQKRWTTAQLASVLAAQDLAMAPPPAPAKGLFLWQVNY